MRTSRPLSLLLGVVAALALASVPAEAQYFGQNKVQYQRLRLPGAQDRALRHLLLPEKSARRPTAARIAERWYARLSSRLFEQSSRRPPAASSSTPAIADFRADERPRRAIGEGTGGVTERFKRRIVLPSAGSLAETDHVLGHELVHAFQYDIAGQDAPRLAPRLVRLPLWFVEGIAEYLSIGPVDSNTAMWLRDSLNSDKLPTLREHRQPPLLPLPLRPGVLGLRRGPMGRQDRHPALP